MSRKTRAKVMAAAEELGYWPSANARGLATGRSMVLGLHVPFTSAELVLNPFHMLMFPAMMDAALEHGYSCILLPEKQDDARPTLRRLLQTRRVDGVILVDPEESSGLPAELVKHDHPFVSVARFVGPEGKIWVDNDLYSACTNVLDHLRERGYRSPALVSIQGQQSYVGDHARAYQDWCERHDVEPRNYWVDSINEAAGYDAVRSQLSKKSRPDALVCVHDLFAVGALRAARDAGLRVPEELGIAGSTDTLAAHAVPPLTSVRCYPGEIGRRAIEVLIDLIDGKPAASVVVPTTLVMRESTARR